MTFRSAIPDFQTANLIYTGATVSFFTVDEDGVSTGDLATLYAAPTGATTVSNPQTLDSEGKFAAPVYIAEPVIGEAEGPNVSSHTTGVINARGTWRGDWLTATVYYSTDLIRDPDSFDVYVAVDSYISGASVAADVTAGHLEVVLDQVELTGTPLAGNIWGPAATVASASSVDLGATTTVFTKLTGTTTVTSLGSGADRLRIIQTPSAVPFSPSASLITPRNEAYTSSAGQVFLAASDDAGIWTLFGVGNREVLSANRTYYVRSNGSDSNTGLANTAGGAFLTPQKAIDTILRCLDLNGKTVTVDLTGAFTSGAAAAGAFLGDGTVIITSSAGASITTADNHCISASFCAALRVNGNLTLSTTGTAFANCLSAWAFGRIEFSGLTFGASIGSHLQAGWLVGVTDFGVAAYIGAGVVVATGNYTITGGGQSHMHVTSPGATISVNSGVTVTLTGTPAFSAYFVGVTAGFVYSHGAVYSGSATGPRYYVHRGGTITAGSSANRTFFPGSTAGSVVAGGFYVSSDDNLSDLGVAKIIGGTGTTGTQLTIQTTSGIGTTDQIEVLGGNNGATVFGIISATNWDLRSATLAPSFGISGTGGLGFVAFGAQSSPPAAGAMRVFADATARFSWIKVSDGFIRTLGGVLTADRVYTLPDASDTLVGKATTDTLTNKTFNTNGTGNAFTLDGAAFTTAANARAALRGGSIYVTATGIDLNSVADTAIALPALPTGMTRYQVWQIAIRNSGSVASLTSAQYGLFTAAAGAGVALIASGTALSGITTNAANTLANGIVAVAANNTIILDIATVTTIYFRVTQVQAAGAAVDVTLFLRPMP